MPGSATSTFTVHSTTAVSTSNAEAIGVSAKEILKRSPLSIYSTFQKHYSKEIINEQLKEVLALKNLLLPRTHQFCIKWAQFYY